MNKALQVITYAIETPPSINMCIISLLLCSVCEHIDQLHVWHHKLKSRLLVNEVLAAYAVNENQ
jgi:hypothetical protein